LGALATPELWRNGFFVLGAASILSGILIWFLVDEPIRGESEPEMMGQLTQEDADRYKAKFSDIRKLMRIPTIWVAIGQGLAGSMPWVVMGAFLILWLVEVRGVDTTQAPLIFGGVVIGTAISNVMGGIIGDYAEKVSPKYGRAFIGQLSVFMGIPFTYILFTRTENWTLIQLAILCFVTALLISWPGKGSKEPMIQGVVPPELRSSAFSFITFIESGFAAIAALIFGILADTINIQTAMLWTIPFPWLICGILFTGFYFTYPKDAKNLRNEMARRASELGITK
jgi:predicted MFS family arabinose efflux permease